jgi:MerR HTH family regulatory protein
MAAYDGAQAARIYDRPHPMATTREVDRLRGQGLLTSGAVARALGIPLNTLRGLEGRLFNPVRREGKRRLRVFTPEQVERLRAALSESGKARPQAARSRMNKSGASVKPAVAQRVSTSAPSG